jgi:hypothetical protein
MKKKLFARLIAMSAVCLVATGQPVWAQPAVAAGVTKTVDAARDDGPPTYMLVLAGFSAVLFVTRRRKR